MTTIAGRVAHTSLSRRPTWTLPSVALGADVLLVTAALALGAMGRDAITLFDRDGVAFTPVTLTAALLMAVTWIAVIAAQGGYSHQVFGAGSDEYKRIAHASLLTAATVGLGCYAADVDLSRGFFALTFLVGTIGLLLGRFILRRGLHRLRRNGSLTQTVIIAGERSHVDDIAAVLRREPWLGYRVCGALTPARDSAEETVRGIPVLGDTGDAAAVVLREGADMLFIAGGAFGDSGELRSVAWELEEHKVEVVVAPTVTDISVGRTQFRPVGGLPLVHIEGPRAMRAARWSKRCFDVVGATIALLLFSPVLLFAALRIMLNDAGPVIFRHTRVGRDGSLFECLKFRTMVPGAESQVVGMQDQLGASALLFKVKDDPRITVPGRWLRRFSIDELPQLLNVLRGDMSLVGPRPQAPREVALYERAMHRRLRVRPGLTGLWQVSGRNDLTPREAMRLDIYYVDNWSMMQDLIILMRTTTAVLSSRGAY